MRTFVILCLMAAATAQYEYSGQTADSIGGAEDYTGANGGADDFSNAIGSQGQRDYSAPVFAPASDFEKEFFTFTAPESEFEDSSAAEKVAAAVKRSLRVIFIKGPENAALENAALQLAKSAANERTAIYVLNKQADIGGLANKLNILNKNNNNRPEVHFVKYRTQADAENAQRSIQAQYDLLPGASSSTNGGAAPVLDFASKAPLRLSGSLSSTASASSNSQTAPSSSSSSYIPPQSSYLPTGRRV